MRDLLVREITLLQHKVVELQSQDLGENYVEILRKDNLEKVSALLQQIQSEEVLDSLFVENSNSGLSISQIVNMAWKSKSLVSIALSVQIFNRVRILLTDQEKTVKEKLAYFIKETSAKGLISLLENMLEALSLLIGEGIKFLPFYELLNEQNKKTLLYNVEEVIKIIKNPTDHRVQNSIPKLVDFVLSCLDEENKKQFTSEKENYQDELVVFAQNSCSDDANIFQQDNFSKVSSAIHQILTVEFFKDFCSKFLKDFCEEERETANTRKGSFLGTLKTQFIPDTNLEDFNKKIPIVRAVARVMHYLGDFQEEILEFLKTKTDGDKLKFMQALLVPEKLQKFEGLLKSIVNFQPLDQNNNMTLLENVSKVMYAFENSKDAKVRKDIEICLDVVLSDNKIKVDENLKNFVLDNWLEILLRVGLTGDNSVFSFFYDHNVKLSSVRYQDNGDTLLHEAVRSGSVGEVISLLKNSPELMYVKNNEQQTPLRTINYTKDFSWEDSEKILAFALIYLGKTADEVNSLMKVKGENFNSELMKIKDEQGNAIFRQAIEFKKEGYLHEYILTVLGIATKRQELSLKERVQKEDPPGESSLSINDVGEALHNLEGADDSKNLSDGDNHYNSFEAAVEGSVNPGSSNTSEALTTDSKNKITTQAEGINDSSAAEEQIEVLYGERRGTCTEQNIINNLGTPIVQQLSTKCNENLIAKFIGVTTFFGALFVIGVAIDIVQTQGMNLEIPSNALRPIYIACAVGALLSGMFICCIDEDRENSHFLTDVTAIELLKNEVSHLVER